MTLDSASAHTVFNYSKFRRFSRQFEDFESFSCFKLWRCDRLKEPGSGQGVTRVGPRVEGPLVGRLSVEKPRFVASVSLATAFVLEVPCTVTLDTLLRSCYSQAMVRKYLMSQILNLEWFI